MVDPAQKSATTHWTVRPYTEKEQRRLRKASRWRSLTPLILGPIFLVAGLVALLWLLTAHTVTATATSCEAEHVRKGRTESKCVLSWPDGSRSRTKTDTLDQPGAVGRHVKLMVDGLGIPGAIPETNAEIVAAALTGFGGFYLGVGLLFRHLDRRHKL